VEGLDAAQARFAAADLAHDEDKSFQALFEMLAWVGAIRDHLFDDDKPIPPVLDGLYYIRNLVIHQGADVVDWIFSLTSPAIGASALGAGPIGGGQRYGDKCGRLARSCPIGPRGGAQGLPPRSTTGTWREKMSCGRSGISPANSAEGACLVHASSAGVPR
jgi:hypothetical protein